jgi:hypothetical protein
MMEAMLSSETPVLTRATRRNIAGDDFLHLRKEVENREKCPTFCDIVTVALKTVPYETKEM